MKVNIILYVIALILFCACSESEYELNNLVPEEYHKILYVNNSGKQQLTLYDTEMDNIYTLSVIKSGSEPNQTASANIKIMTQAELDESYSNIEAVNYKIISESSFSLETTHLDFSVEDRYKLINILLKPQAVKASMEDDPTAVWVLPLYVSSETDSVNVEKNELFLQMIDVVTPEVGFVNGNVELNTYDYGSSTISERISVGLNTSNNWDIELTLGIDDDYVDTYNAANGTSFQHLSNTIYSIPESVSLPNGTTSVSFLATINTADLTPGDYMLAIRINSTSLFEISSSEAIYPLAIRILGKQLDRSGWTASANTEEPTGEGSGNGVASCILDDNLSTYWHSQWSGGSHALPHELIIDANKEYYMSQIAMVQRQNESYADTHSGVFYLSLDGSNWIEAGRFSMEQTIDPQMFSITSMTARYIKIQINQSYRDLNCSLSEVYVYGLE